MFTATTELKQLHHITKLTKALSQTYSGGTYLSLIGMVLALLTIASHSTMLPSTDILRWMHLARACSDCQWLQHDCFAEVSIITKIKYIITDARAFNCAICMSLLG